MDKLKFVNSDTEYLDLAKSITNALWNLTINKAEKDYSIGTLVAGISIGTYMFLKHVASGLEDVKAIDLYNDFDEWVKWVDSVNEVQTQEGVSRCEN